mgnify:CR=1 FL=1
MKNNELVDMLLLQGDSIQILIEKIRIEKKWADLCHFQICDAFAGNDGEIPFEYMKEFSPVPIPAFKSFYMRGVSRPHEFDIYLQGKYYFIEDSPSNLWLFCKYCEQEKKEHHVFYKPQDWFGDEAESEYVVWLPNDKHINDLVEKEI